MVEYRRRIEVESKSDYWWVEMGELNFLNGGCSYPFPTVEAAHRFAQTQKNIAKRIHGVDRDVKVRHPNGEVDEL